MVLGKTDLTNLIQNLDEIMLPTAYLYLLNMTKMVRKIRLESMARLTMLMGVKSNQESNRRSIKTLALTNKIKMSKLS